MLFQTTNRYFTMWSVALGRYGDVPSRLLRGNRTSKVGNASFYKGRGAPTYGRHTSKGNEREGRELRFV
jgi:hypothetical protein